MNVPEERMVIGLGNDSRGDDACGLAVARAVARSSPRRVRVEECQGDVTTLLDLWQDVPLVVVADAMRSSRPPGTVLRIEVLEPGFERAPTPSSTHGLSLHDAVGLGKALGKLPGRLVLYAIEAGEVTMGLGLGPEVARAVPLVTEQILSEVGAAREVPSGFPAGGAEDA